MSKKMIFLIIIGFLILCGIFLFMIRDKDIKSNLEKYNDSRLKMSINNKEYFIKLISNETNDDLVSLLPIEVEFEDFNNTEKIAYLPRKLKLDNNPLNYNVEIGDLTYYVPWGNLAIFYKEFHSSNSLLKLGEFENGIEDLKDLKGKAIISLVD